MTRRAPGATLALALLLGAGAGLGAPTDPVAAPSDSTGVAPKAAHPDSTVPRDSTGTIASTAAVPDSLGRTAADSTRKRELPPRTLTLRQQVMFAGGFMGFVALMMASMQNFNP